jgi:hypothetical protein
MFGRIFRRKKKGQVSYTVTLHPDAYVEQLDRLIKHCDIMAVEKPHVAIAMKAKASAYLNAKRLYLDMTREQVTELHENNIEAIKRRDRGE